MTGIKKRLTTAVSRLNYMNRATGYTIPIVPTLAVSRFIRLYNFRCIISSVCAGKIIKFLFPAK